MKLNRRQQGNTLLGVFAGIVIGVLISLGVVWMMNSTPVPFRDNGAQTERPADAEQSGTADAAPGQPGNKADDKSGSKPRFEFYKILPKDQDPVPAPVAQPKSVGSAPVYLQVGAFQNASDADNLKAKLALIGLDAGVQAVDLPDKGRMYRVRTGPFSSVDEMNRARGLLSQNGIRATQVTGK